MYRVVLDVPTADDAIPFDVWKSILATPELRQEWDPAVDGAALLEMLDPTTRISKTNFTLGWPAKCVRHPPYASFLVLIHSNSPRDAVTISRTFNDATTIIDVSTSLPRSPDDPAYLRPSPPYVRSNVKREDTSQSIEYIGLTCMCSIRMVYPVIIARIVSTANYWRFLRAKGESTPAHHMLLAARSSCNMEYCDCEQLGSAAGRYGSRPIKDGYQKAVTRSFGNWLWEWCCRFANTFRSKQGIAHI